MTDIPPRWYCVDAHGLATLCASETNAREEAAENDIRWPRNAPHTAVQLAPAPAKGAEGVEALASNTGWHVPGDPEVNSPEFWTFGCAELHEFARRLRNSPQPDVAAEVLRIADEREAGYSRREHGGVVNGRAADAVVALAESLRNSSEIPNSSFSLLSLIADIRAAAGDPTGKLMQDELVAHIRTLRENDDRYRWLSDQHGSFKGKYAVVGEDMHVLGPSLDAAIDAARSAGGDDA